MSDEKISERVIGDRPVRTLIQLVIASVIVGAIFRFFGIGPKEFWTDLLSGIRNLITGLGDTAAEIVFTILTYFAIGAAIVLPIWILMRLINGRPRSRTVAPRGDMEDR